MVRVAVLMLMVLLTGCQLMRAPVPERIQGLDYAAIAELGALEGECSTLAQLHRDGERVRGDLLEQRLLPECRVRIREAQQQLKETQEAVLLAARERRRLEREQAQVEHQRRQREEREAQRQRAEAIEEFMAREETLFREARLRNTRVLEALAEVPERPLAHFTGQPGEAPLHRFLACMEISYANGGYEVKHGGRELDVVIREVGMPRGQVPVEMRFRQQGGYWLMTHLRVADMEARTAEDRFVLSQNLVVQGCPEDQTLFGF